MVNQVNHFGGFEEANISEQLCTDVYAFIQNRDTIQLFSLLTPYSYSLTISAFAYILLVFFSGKTNKQKPHNYFLFEISFAAMSSRINFPW